MRWLGAWGQGGGASAHSVQGLAGSGGHGLSCGHGRGTELLKQCLGDNHSANRGF